MVERWRLESHTFHLLVGECLITFKDIALQLGLRVDGRPVTDLTLMIGNKCVQNM